MRENTNIYYVPLQAVDLSSLLNQWCVRKVRITIKILHGQIFADIWLIDSKLENEQQFYPLKKWSTVFTSLKIKRFST